METAMFELAIEAVSMPVPVSLYVILIVVEPVPAADTLIVGAGVVTSAVGRAVSTMKLLNVALAVMALPARSRTPALRPMVYVPCVLAPHVPDGALIV